MTDPAQQAVHELRLILDHYANVYRLAAFARERVTTDFPVAVRTLDAMDGYALRARNALSTLYQRSRTAERLAPVDRAHAQADDWVRDLNRIVTETHQAVVQAGGQAAVAAVREAEAQR